MDQSKVQSNQWKALYAKFIIQTRTSEPQCQNQNLVKQFVQTAMAVVSLIFQETGVG